MKPRILVIDDEASIRDTLRMILEYEGYEVLQAATGDEGVRLIEREAPDLVFLDIKMPGMDGLDVLQKVRHLTDSTPIVVISGHVEQGGASSSEAAEAIKLGARDFIEKPPTQDRILVTVRNALDTSRTSAVSAGGVAPACAGIGTTRSRRRSGDSFEKSGTASPATWFCSAACLSRSQNASSVSLFAFSHVWSFSSIVMTAVPEYPLSTSRSTASRSASRSWPRFHAGRTSLSVASIAICACCRMRTSSLVAPREPATVDFALMPSSVRAWPFFCTSASRSLPHADPPPSPCGGAVATKSRHARTSVPKAIDASTRCMHVIVSASLGAGATSSRPSPRRRRHGARLCTGRRR